MVEVSPKLSEMQQEKLTGVPIQENTEAESQEESKDRSTHYYRHCTSKYGPKVYWYDNLKKVPEGFTYFIAHEFFDALPIHKFQVSTGVANYLLQDRSL